MSGGGVGASTESDLGLFLNLTDATDLGLFHPLPNSPHRGTGGRRSKGFLPRVKQSSLSQYLTQARQSELVQDSTNGEGHLHALPPLSHPKVPEAFDTRAMQRWPLSLPECALWLRNTLGVVKHMLELKS